MAGKISARRVSVQVDGNDITSSVGDIELTDFVIGDSDATDYLGRSNSIIEVRGKVGMVTGRLDGEEVNDGDRKNK